MTVPAIRNYETRPPIGGWGLEYDYKGQKFNFTGGWRDVTRKIVNLHQKNHDPITVDAAFGIANEIWCRRDPERCMTPAQRSVAQKATGSTCSRCGHRRR